jgi:hypothetical protein
MQILLLQISKLRLLINKEIPNNTARVSTRKMVHDLKL